MVQRIREAANRGSWRAAIELLSRRLPEDRGDRQRIDINAEIRDTLLGLGEIARADVAGIERDRAAREADPPTVAELDAEIAALIERAFGG